MGILDKGAIAAEVHREADEVNMLSELGTWFPEMADMKLGSAMNCLALHRFWTIDRPGMAETLPARYFTKKGVSKLIYACRLERAREKAVKNGTAKNLGRYRGLDISTAGIEFVLADPDEQIEILVNPVKELESIMKRPKPVSKKTPIVTDDPSPSDLRNIKSASKTELQGMVTQLLTDLDSANAEKEQLRLELDEALLALRQDIGSHEPSLVNLQVSIPVNGDMPALVPDTSDTPKATAVDIPEEALDFESSDADPVNDDVFDIVDVALDDAAPVTEDVPKVALEKLSARATSLAAAHYGIGQGASISAGTVQ